MGYHSLKKQIKTPDFPSRLGVSSGVASVFHFRLCSHICTSVFGDVYQPYIGTNEGIKHVVLLSGTVIILEICAKSIIYPY